MVITARLCEGYASHTCTCWLAVAAGISVYACVAFSFFMFLSSHPYRINLVKHPMLALEKTVHCHGCCNQWLTQQAAITLCPRSSFASMALRYCSSFSWLLQPVNELCGHQRSNSIASHTKYFRSPVRWMVSEYGPFLELAHTCATLPMKLSSM